MRSVHRFTAALAGVVLLLAGCADTAAQTRSSSAKSADAPLSGNRSADPKGSSARPAKEDVAVSAPASLDQPLLSSDVLVYSRDTLPKSTIEKIRGIKEVTHVEPFSMGSFYADDRPVTYAAVNPKTFWRFTPPGTAHTQAVWDRVAGGEMAVEPALGKKLQDRNGYFRLGNEADAKQVHIGAYAQILDPGWARHIDAVLNYKWAEPLGMTRRNAMLVAMGSPSPQKIRKKLQQYAGDRASVQLLGPDLDLKATQTAILTGGSVAAAVGKFNYAANPDGTIRPDPAWVRANIRTEQVPILGTVTCHRVMLPQLRSALSEIVSRGLADKIHKNEYGGCYYPRFIAYDPSKGLSFHSFGTAVDLNVPGNGRGTRGEMDRTVVSIFKKWGFGWGGDWNYTDPMHFELAELVDSR